MKHGMSKLVIYKTWCHIKQRCLDKNKDNYKYYGGRGIKICDKWLDFNNFYKDMGSTWFEKASIERLDVNGNYCKENCKWILMEKQNLNKRNTFYVTIKGTKMTLDEAIKKYSTASKVAIWKRIKRGWDVEHAVMEPPDLNMKKNIYRKT